MSATGTLKNFVGFGKGLNMEHNTFIDKEPRAPLQNQSRPQPRKKNWRKEARSWIVCIAAALMVVFVIRTFFFQIIRVDGISMQPTLLDKERLFVNVFDMRINGLERGDIVICHYPNRGRLNFVKRVVAIPGDQVYRKNSETHVVYEMMRDDGSSETVDEILDVLLPGQGHPYFASPDYAPYTLDKDEYFVVGDNRYGSHDSRDWNDDDPSMDVGPISKDMILGNVCSVIWPLNNIRCVE